ncbi:MAG: type II CAAX endopeptidase family protein [Thermoanaerobacterium sp.]|nr:type II CAAX endopeptidase family protein [Thermoanaerobacterium sp.]
MRKKIGIWFELAFVYITALIIAGFSTVIVSLGGDITTKIIITLLVYVVVTAIPFLIIILRKIPFTQLGYTKDNIGKQLKIVFFIFCITISFVVLPLFFGVSKEDVLSIKYSSIWVLLFYLIYDFLFVGFGEEFIFRGYFIQRLAVATKSDLFAIIFSSLLFGLWHFPNGRNALQVIMTTILGLFYGFSKYKMKNCSTVSVSVAHGLHDATIALLSYFLL